MMIADLVHTRVTCTRYRQGRVCEDMDLVERQAGNFSERILGVSRGKRREVLEIGDIEIEKNLHCLRASTYLPITGWYTI